MDGFYLGPLYVYTWGLTAAIGIAVALATAAKKISGIKSSGVGSSFEPKSTNSGSSEGNLLESRFWNLTILLVISIFFGARLLYIFENWDYYSADPLAVFRLWQGGFSFFGGAAGVILAGYSWSRVNKIDFWFLGWVFTPAWLFGLFFGRLGCSLIHDHLGKTTGLPWGIWVQNAYRHEPALYEAVWLLLVGISLYFWDFIENRIGYLPNNLFPLSLLLYSVGRFLLDFTRADDSLYFNLTIAQWMCIITIIWTGVLIAKNKTHKS